MKLEHQIVSTASHYLLTYVVSVMRVTEETVHDSNIILFEIYCSLLYFYLIVKSIIGIKCVSFSESVAVITPNVSYIVILTSVIIDYRAVGE